MIITWTGMNFSPKNGMENAQMMRIRTLSKTIRVVADKRFVTLTPAKLKKAMLKIKNIKNCTNSPPKLSQLFLYILNYVSFIWFCLKIKDISFSDGFSSNTWVKFLETLPPENCKNAPKKSLFFVKTIEKM